MGSEGEGRPLSGRAVAAGTEDEEGGGKGCGQSHSMCKGPGVEGNAERLSDRTGCLELGARGLLLRGHCSQGVGTSWIITRSVASPGATEPLTGGLFVCLFASSHNIVF